ncbi:MAG: aldo/keto reductase [Cellvibrionaceae bacterium]
MPSLHDYRNSIADTGIRVSPIGLGTVKLGRNQGVKYPTTFDLPSDRDAANLIAQARDLGINLIDTAPAYGISEQRLGSLLKGQREHWVICSKVGEEFIDAQSSFDFSAEHTIKSVERSLQRLQTDRIELVLVHSDGNDLDILNNGECFDTLRDLKQQGKILAYGMSTKTVEGGLRAAEQSDCVMATYNLNHKQEQPVLDYARQHNKGILIKKALASGHITVDNPKQTTDPVQASMDFLFAEKAMTSAIIGTITPKHLADNCKKALISLEKQP